MRRLTQYCKRIGLSVPKICTIRALCQLFLCSELCSCTLANSSRKVELYLLSTIPASTRSNSNLLRLFIYHYVRLGVPIENFLLVIHGTNEEAIRRKVVEVQEFGVVHTRSWCGNFYSYRKKAEYFLLHEEANVVHSWQWVVQVDSDEFLVSNRTLHEWVSFLREKKVHGLSLCFADRVAHCGRIPPTIPSSPKALHELFPLVCPVSRSLGIHPLLKMAMFSAVYRSASHKFMNHWCREGLFRSKQEFAFACRSVRMHKPKKIRVFEGSCSYPEGQSFLHHFKWYGDIVEALAERAENRRQEGAPWYKQSESFLDLWRRDQMLPLKGCKLADDGRSNSAGNWHPHREICRNRTSSYK